MGVGVAPAQHAEAIRKQESSCQTLVGFDSIQQHTPSGLMARPSRKPPPQDYEPVSTVPSQPSVMPRNKLSRSYAHDPQSSNAAGRGAMSRGVASGAIGGGYGPYTYHPQASRDAGQSGRFSNSNPPSSSSHTHVERPLIPPQRTTTGPYPLNAKDADYEDGFGHSRRDDGLESPFTIFSLRGWINVFALFVLLFGLITLFAGYPIIHFATSTGWGTGKSTNIVGVNASGQVPSLPGLRGLIDPDTDKSVYKRTGSDGYTYELVFSDEFNLDGRTFYSGDDPYWEAVDMNYWPTGDIEWYSPDALTTADGKLVITMEEVNTHNLNFRSGMLTSWNKFCFTTGYIEFAISLPGTPRAPGFWPAAWLMGNLGRAGYGATTEGTWPYTYDSCDLGTFPNQTSKTGAPAAAATGGLGGGPLSYLPGQRLSACTCPGSDHPGPSTNVGRGVPEIDILEAQIDVALWEGQVSQSAQVAPFDYQYTINNSSSAMTIFNSTATYQNTYTGGIWQQAVSSLTYLNNSNYGGNGYGVYGVEWFSNPSDRAQGYITWYSDAQESWKITSQAIGPDSTSQVSQRLISEEPMYIVMNFGMSPSFQAQDFMHLQFPSKMYIDYVRVYQREGTGSEGVTCDPSSHPTADYINNHLNAYSNPNLTTWAQAGYTFPRNSLYDGC